MPSKRVHLIAEWTTWSEWTFSRLGSRTRKRQLKVGPAVLATHSTVVVQKNAEHIWAPGTYHGVEIGREQNVTFYRRQRTALARLGVLK